MLFVNIGNDVVIDMISDMVVNTMNGWGTLKLLDRSINSFK